LQLKSTLKGIRRDESDVSESSGEEEEFDSSEDESDKESTDQSDGSSSDESDTASSSEEAGTSSEDESDDDTPLMASTPKRRRL
jgi:ribonuclease E